MPDAPATPRHPDDSVIGTLQSLIVAFVLAMTFRGFVTEGFVIPTGSMAPTLLGRNIRVHSRQTGWDFPLGVEQSAKVSAPRLADVADPMLGSEYPGSAAAPLNAATRMGDRILVLKSLFPFSPPSRFDVVVFKNPTNPNGEDGNYIKRLIGLPNESIWIVDGDVFAAPADGADDLSTYQIQRKPKHVQRAIWQPIFNSDFFPVHPQDLDTAWRGGPWRGEGWQTDGQRAYRTDTASPTWLEWDNRARMLDDWASYNTLLRSAGLHDSVPVHDLRIAASILPDHESLGTTLEIVGRSTAFELTLADGSARVRLCDADVRDVEEAWQDLGAAVPFDGFPAGRPTTVEFWHVDQTLSLYVDGKRLIHEMYDWGPEERLRRAHVRDAETRVLARQDRANATEIRWMFEGSPVWLEKVRVDRDIYYRSDNLRDATLRNPTNAGFGERVRLRQPGFGTHPDNLAILGPDQFFMCGDNSTASSDSRLWGNPHPVVAQQIDPAPFVVNRRLLLGKAWVVYFPAPHAMTQGGRALIPDFGGLRFIR